MSNNEKPVAVVPRDLEDLIPDFMKRRHEEIETIKELIAAGDFETLARTGHTLKGNGPGYGFPGLGELGLAIELAAKGQDSAKLNEALASYESYVANVEITYED
jgi:HPt (histidine-containing phosphotransfer) domain-containing protein